MLFGNRMFSEAALLSAANIEENQKKNCSMDTDEAIGAAG